MDEPLLCGNIVDTLDIFRKYTYLYYVRHKSANRHHRDVRGGHKIIHSNFKNMNKIDAAAPQTATTPAQSANITISTTQVQATSISEVQTPATPKNTTTSEDDIDRVAYRRIHALANCAGELILATYSNLFPYRWEKDGMYEVQNSKIIDDSIVTCTCRDKYIQVQLTTREGVSTLLTIDESKNLPPHNCGQKQ